MDQTRYKIMNTTRKPAPKHGPDTRSVREKVGHNVSFPTDDGGSAIVTPGRFALTTHLSEGLLGLQRCGDVHIEKAGDITEMMKQHALAPDQPSRATRPEPNPNKALTPDRQTKPGLFPDDAPQGVKRQRSAKAVEMGKDQHENTGGREHEGARNPDGEPNFLVKTKEVERRRRGKDSQTGV